MEAEHLDPSCADELFSPANSVVTTCSRAEWLFVLYGPPADSGRRSWVAPAGVSPDVFAERHVASIEELMAKPQFRRAALTREELVACRLYTGPMYERYNSVMRRPAEHRGQFVYTLHILASAILKLSRIAPARTVYRGLKGGLLPRVFFEPSEFGTRGGTEFGFMSTTTDPQVAAVYATPQAVGGNPDRGKSVTASVVFEISQGAIDRGAEIAWLSQFPKENEVLFPPLTYLEVMGEPRTHGMSIFITLRANLNLRLHTVDQVIHRAKTFLTDTLEFFAKELAHTILPGGINPGNILPGWLQPFDSFVARVQATDGARYNTAAVYRAAVDRALDVKQGTVNRLLVLQSLLTLQRFEVADWDGLRRTIADLRSADPAPFADPEYCTQFLPFHGHAGERDLVRPSTGQVSPVAQGAHATVEASAAGAATDGVRLRFPGDDGAAPRSAGVTGAGGPLPNYRMLWRLPIRGGSWDRLVARAGDRGLVPLRVAGGSANCVQWLIQLGFSVRPLRMAMEPMFGTKTVDVARGLAGTFVPIARSGETGVLYQLLRSTGELSHIFLFYCGSRWYIGPEPGVEQGLARSQPCPADDPRAPEAGQWEERDARGIKYSFVRSGTFTRAPRLRLEPDSSRTGAATEAGAATGPLMRAGEPLTGKRIAAPHLSDGPRAAHASARHRLAELLAFVQRIDREAASRAAQPETLSWAEVASIAAVCDHTGTRLPLPVQQRVKKGREREEQAASAWASFMVLAVVLGALVGATALIVGAALQLDELVWFTRGFWSAGTLAAVIVCIGTVAVFAGTFRGALFGLAVTAGVAIIGGSVFVTSGGLCSPYCLEAASVVGGLIYIVFGIAAMVMLAG
jgi:hypothetical protein